MPDTVSMPQPHHSLYLRHGKESPGRQMGSNTSPTGFPEYLKHVDMLKSSGNGFKITASNSLFQTVLQGRVRNTVYLLDRGTSVNGRNDYGFSVLTAALHIDEKKRRDRMFRMLLERGADPHFKDGTFQRNILHWACVLGRAEQVEALLDEVAVDLNLREKDSENYTALHHAVMTGQLAVVILVVDIHRKFGVTVDVADNLGLTPYLHAKRLGYREVAAYLHGEGMASQGHGDMLFRTPREWSQIGKFERQKAVEIHTQEIINIAKIQGSIKYLRSLETSPRQGAASLVLPHCSPSHSPRVVRLAAARHSDRLSTSLPSLQEEKHGGGGGGGRPTKGILLRRPTSANGAVTAATGGGGGGADGADSVDNANITHVSVDSSRPTPGPPREAFVLEAATNPSPPTASRDLMMNMTTTTTSTTTSPRRAHLLLPTGGRGAGVEGRGQGVASSLLTLPAIRGGWRGGVGGGGWGGGGGVALSSHRHSGAAFTLMEMNVKGRHASTYRQSQFDETKASEYKHILGNLNSIMDILSQQQSRSFRKSVKYQRPETPKKTKPKQKVSSLAVIFGRNKGRRSKRRSARQQQPSSRKKESASTKKKKTTEKGGGDEKKGHKAPEKKKAVPLLKVNDKVV